MKKIPLIIVFVLFASVAFAEYGTHDGSGNVTGLNARGSNEFEYSPSDLTYGRDNEFYTVVGGVLTPKSIGDVQAILQARQNEITAKLQRLENIAAAQETQGLKTVTVAQAENYIENQFDLTDLDATGAAIQSATTVEELRAAIYATLLELRQLWIKTEQTHKREIPYLLD